MEYKYAMRVRILPVRLSMLKIYKLSKQAINLKEGQKTM